MTQPARYILDNTLTATYEADTRPKVATPEDLIKIIDPLIVESRQERFYTVALNYQLRLISVTLNYIGTNSQINIEIKDILRPALQSGADYIIVFHNHPGGDPKPSPEDENLTASLIKACKLLDLPLLDHVVISQNGYQSIRRNNPHLWNA